MRFNFDNQTLIHPPEDVADFVECLITKLIQNGRYFLASDRRAETRHPVAIQVSVMPLFSDLQPAGGPFVATTKDISHASITIIHTKPVDAPLLAIQLTDISGAVLHSAVDVLRCQPTGPYFEIVGKYITKIYDPKPKPSEPASAVLAAEPKTGRRWLPF